MYDVVPCLEQASARGVLKGVRRCMHSLDPRDPASSFADVLDALPIIAFMARPDGSVSYVSRAWSRVTGLQQDVVLHNGYLDWLYPEDVEHAVGVWSAAVARAEPYRDEYRFRFADGSYHWLLSQAAPLFDDQGRVTTWFGTVTIIDNRKRAERGLRLLSSTGAASVRALDYHATLQNFVDAMVEEFASYCIIDVADDDHPWERFAAHRDPAVAPRLVALSRPAPEHHIARAIAGGEAGAIPIDERWLEEVHASDDRAAFIRDHGVRSVIIAPVRAPDGHVIGAITAGVDRSDRTGRVYTDDDVQYVEEVGRRAGASITNARLYERQRRIAVELQSASLPIVLPQPPGLSLAAFYRPGSDEATIGGDWYDAFVLEDRRIVLTVGDVRGHGLHAAITMTKLRQAMQSAAMVEANPAVMLAVADRTMRLVDPDSFATAVAAIFDPATQTLVAGSAGHPPPLVVSATSIEELPVRGPVLGLGGRGTYDLAHVRLDPGALLVFYADGLVEATRDLEAGYARLLCAVREEMGSRSASAAEAIVRAALADTPATDDVAVLTAIATAVPAVDVPTLPASDPELTWTFDSEDAASAQATRHAFAALVRERERNRIDVGAAELIVGELTGNVVRHASGSVTVTARWVPDGIAIGVLSDGPRFTPPSSISDEFAESGRGLFLVRALSAAFDVRSSADGRCEVVALLPFVEQPVVAAR